MNTGSTPPVTSVTSFFAFLLPHNSVYPRPSAFLFIHYMATLLVTLVTAFIHAGLAVTSS